MKLRFAKKIEMVLCCVIILVACPTYVKAAPTATLPSVSYMPMWYYLYNGTTSPEIHEYYFFNTMTEPGVAYIAEHGLYTYTTKENLNIEQVLVDNPDLAAAGLLDADSIWNFLVTYDSVSPRMIHSNQPDEEYYCLLRNICISLGTYPYEGNPLSVTQKAKIINDYICQNYSYDFSFQVYSFQGMMNYGVGVCNAYTGMFDALASISGITAGTMSGPNHIWNAIQTEDGQWYEIDVTWNDECENEYFMLKNHNSAPSSSYNPMTALSMDWWITEDLY